jgi:hypothetical protein
VQATKFGLNLKPPTQIGTTIPPSGLARKSSNSQFCCSPNRKSVFSRSSSFKPLSQVYFIPAHSGTIYSKEYEPFDVPRVSFLGSMNWISSRRVFSQE